MKLLILALASLLSFSTFAQDKVDFILYRLHAVGDFANITREFSLAKVEMTRERYERMLSEDLMMYCRTTKDKSIDLVFYKSQITAHYKGGKTPVGRCEGNGCYNESFEDLSDILNGASNGVFDSSIPETKDYFMGSIANYEDFKRGRDHWGLPEVSEIPYVTIYDPAVHTKVPVKNSFVCAIQNAKTGEHVSP
ncbi:MAG: hypothetical protein NDI69_14505 [Bacteriovoracaceae bacterium]|nr:hypothetical protein [Bacteriovoracaceae bacterium]